METFIGENNIIQLHKDPTELFQKQIQQTLQKRNEIIDKTQHKYILQIKTTAPHLTPSSKYKKIAILYEE